MFVVPELIARIAGLSIFKFLRYIKDEMLLFLDTSFSESALPGLVEKRERFGCSKSVVGFVVPTGYVPGIAMVWGIGKFMSECRASPATASLASSSRGGRTNLTARR